jgi:four helix bundle protein
MTAMTESLMKARTKAFALRTLTLIDALPDSRSSRIVAGQLGRAGTSVGANYRAVCRAKSAADMINKLTIVEEEADESAFWLEIVIERGLLPESKATDLYREAGELTAIMVASRKTLLQGNRKSKIENRK